MECIFQFFFSLFLMIFFFSSLSSSIFSDHQVQRVLQPLFPLFLMMLFSLSSFKHPQRSSSSRESERHNVCSVFTGIMALTRKDNKKITTLATVPRRQGNCLVARGGKNSVRMFNSSQFGVSCLGGAPSRPSAP